MKRYLKSLPIVLVSTLAVFAGTAKAASYRLLVSPPQQPGHVLVVLTNFPSSLTRLT
jgi:hypothetical protein